MYINRVSVNRSASAIHRRLDQAANEVFRSYDGLKARVGSRGRRAGYDDENYEFIGGAAERLRKKHYDKSLRLLWKAEKHAPWSSFRDMTEVEKRVRDLAEQAMDEGERKQLERLSSEDFRALLDRSYSERQKRALVRILSAIGHGEAYAWLVSADVLKDVQSTGAKAAATMQVLEEAKHFVVLRELVRAFGVEVPRLSAWEYLLLERILDSEGLEKLYGMNVVVEGFALNIFGMLSEWPGLEILKLFHLDESRHCGLPVSYFSEFPMSRWQRRNPAARAKRLWLVLPAVPFIFFLEEDLAELGIDAFDFGASTVRKMSRLAERAGFDLLVPNRWFIAFLDTLFNAYCATTRPGYAFKSFGNADTTRGEAERKVEAEIFA